jgi:uncharacterized membrane protein YkvA (DUF1232 family)
MKNSQYEKEYNEETLFKKIIKLGKKIGLKLIYYVLILFYILQDPAVPAKIKAVITCALGYFIFPFDIFPDSMPGIGYVDDMATITAALTMSLLYVTPEIKQKAKNKLKDIFGEDIDKELVLIDKELDNIKKV